MEEAGGELLGEHGAAGGEAGEDVALGVGCSVGDVGVLVAGAPALEDEGRNGDVFVVDAEVGAACAVGFDAFYSSAGGLRDFGADYYGACGGEAVGLKGEVLGGVAVHEGCLLDEIDVFVGADAGYGAVVADADEEAAAGVVGECGYGAGYFVGVGDGVFEVLGVILALCYGFGQKGLSAYGGEVFHWG